MKINDLEISEFAPVVIPTLCRSKHLINLLESLSKCKYASETEIYVAVDYPAKESHWEGYRKIVAYLDSAGDMTFKKLHVIKRDHNLGLGIGGNIWTLIDETIAKYPRYILSEDDNTFAPNFLEYMNYNLEKYEHDDSILGVCGYIHPLDFSYANGSVAKLNVFVAWGYGIWRDRYLSFKDSLTSQDRIRQIVMSESFKNCCKEYKRYDIFLELVAGAKRNSWIPEDGMKTALLFYKNMRCVFPTMSLVKNWGWDGSGTHGGMDKRFLNQKIDESTNPFKFNECSEDDNLKISKHINFYMYNSSKIQKVLSNISFPLYNYFHILYTFEIFRSIWRRGRQLRMNILK
jgi:hypothetical protein